MTLLDFCKDFFPGGKAFSVGEDRIEIDLRTLAALEAGADNEPWGKFYGRIVPSTVLEALTGDEAAGCGPCSCCCRGGCEEEEEQREKLVLSREQREKLERFHLVMDPEVKGMSFHVRRPYFRMRGKPVTPEQAFDIIRRTDNFFHDDLDSHGFIPGLLSNRYVLDNVWYSPCFFPHPRGWVRPDGVVGINDITVKYPTEENFAQNLLPLLLNFPYLDLVVAVTDWNEMPPYAWNAFLGKEDDPEDVGDPNAFPGDDYPDFIEHIVYGVWLHDGAMELMAPERTRKVYAEYADRYEGEHPEIFCTSYYDDHGLQPADFDYLKRCIRSHGLDPEEVLAPYRWDSVKGLLLRSWDRMDNGGGPSLPV